MKGAVLVVSNKGGTGKTLVSANIAIGLNEKGYKVGAIDVDVDSSNLGEIFKLKDRMKLDWTNKKFETVEIKKGLNIVAMSLLTDPNKSISMRGKEYSQIVNDMINNTNWDVDYMVLDLSAGLSDIFKTVAWSFAKSLIGAVIVTQPNTISDAKRACHSCKNNYIPIIGIIENMSGFRCECGKTSNPFGCDGYKDVADKYGVELLGQIPLSVKIKENIDNGVVKLPDELIGPINTVVDRITKWEPAKIGILDKLKEGFKKLKDELVEDILKNMIVYANTKINIPEFQAQFGAYKQEVSTLRITKRHTDKILIDWPTVIRDGRLLLLKSPKKVDNIIETDAITFLSCIAGMKRTPDGFVPYEFVDAWSNGDIRTCGAGSTINVFHVQRNIWDAVVPILRKRYKATIMKLL